MPKLLNNPDLHINSYCDACGTALCDNEAVYCEECEEALFAHYSSENAYYELIERPQVEAMNKNQDDF